MISMSFHRGFVIIISSPFYLADYGQTTRTLMICELLIAPLSSSY